MVRYLHTLFYLMLWLASMGWTSAWAQQQIEATPQKGLKYIEAGDFKSAQLVYTHLLKKYPKDAAYNFYMGICLLQNRDDLAEAVKKLNYARIKRVSRNVYYYLGRAHQLSFRFDEAIANFNTFLKNAPANDEKIEDTKLFLEQCHNSRKMASKIYELTVLDKTEVEKNKLLEKYHPAKDVGKLYQNGDFFESGVNPDHIMFETERGDVVYFTMASGVNNSLNIFKIEKLLDGWGESKMMEAPVNSAYNDAYPFMATDGLTFYFSSDRPGGFGGYDIYKAYFDNASQEFLEPINLGVPFNSPDDDFLFVSDDFNQVAWFASNRETTEDTLMVYTVRWDGSQVRNMADDLNQVTESARLLVQDAESISESRKKTGDKNGQKQSSDNNGSLRFQINDTITYTALEHFMSTKALALFKEGYQKEQQKDSLSLLMKQKRSRYAQLNNELEKNKVVNEIIGLEDRVYKLEDDVQEKFLYARQIELNEIKERLSQGNYRPLHNAGINKDKVVSFDGIFIPEKYVFHSSDEFISHYSQQEDMYNTLFSTNDRATLRHADSLYVWANILNLEAARLMEEAANTNETERVKLGDLIKRADSLNDAGQEEGVVSKMIKESKELKILSTRLYHKSLDKKFPVYYLKLKDASRNLTESSSKEILKLSQQGNAYFREAKNVLSETVGLSIEAYERAGTLKRAGIEKQEKALRIYANIDTWTTKGENTTHKTLNDKTGGEQSTSMSTLKKEAQAATHKTNNATKQTKPEAKEEVFKIQIGVFRNAPDQEALAKLPEVSTLQLEGNGLTKYFAGSYKTYEEAQERIPKIIEAGFAGAFVVYFKDSKLSPIPHK